MAKVCIVKGTMEKRAMFIQEQRHIMTVINATMAISFVFMASIIPFLSTALRRTAGRVFMCK